MFHQTSDGGNGRIVVDQSDLGSTEAMGEITSSKVLEKVLEKVNDWWMISDMVIGDWDPSWFNNCGKVRRSKELVIFCLLF